ncbi:hypothetical protein C922_00879 [Plasmodium inui San Antonio 1]|uniref:VWFA domain-containing protein n=1 Tax=Plasmodium inui San Antonio 1 TaxID=1237626 RepID=W7AB15_9APIC|nr:hypothetical protein C922_00879 [Plasmodium inui San Antonio 1]EUD68483.1 hypothetical protein C922_00879 [Plasmodium inui San Antonio 1]
MRRIVRVLLNWILPFFLFRLTQVEGRGLIEKVTSHGDLDLVLLFDAGFKEKKEKEGSKALENITELARKLMVEGERRVNLTYVTYDSVGVQTIARADNRSAKGNTSAARTNGSLQRFSKAVMQTQMQQSQQSSNHLKALNYVGIRHFYDAEDTSTKMVIMFINTEGMPDTDETELSIAHYLLDRKNITLNVITKVNLKSYCHYLHRVGPNTNELLRCVLKNSYYHKSMLIHNLEKFYDDIATNATCSEWSEWSECSVTCNMGYHFSKRNTLNNVENALSGKYKRTGKNCTDQRSLVIQECFDTSCDHSLDVCDIEIDLSLLVDDSSTMSQSFWLKYILKPIRNLISHLNLSSNLVNISLTTFSQETYNWISFSSNLARNRDQLLLFLEYWRFNFGGPSNNLSSALSYMHDHVLNTNEGRPNAHKVLVIFNTGNVSNKAANQAEEIVRNIKLTYGADVYAICLNNSSHGNCKTMSGDSRDIGVSGGTDEMDAPGVVNQDEVDMAGLSKQDKATNNSPVEDAPFFYSYSNLSEFREQLTEIQKNICKNAHQAIVAARRRRRRNLRRANIAGKPSEWHGRRGAKKAGGENEEGEEDEAAEEAIEDDKEQLESEVAPRAEPDADGGTELETKSMVEPGADAASESVAAAAADPSTDPSTDPSIDPSADPQIGQKADQPVDPDVVAESIPPTGLGVVLHEPPNEIEKMAQKLHGDKATNSIVLPPFYIGNGGNLKRSNKNRVILKSLNSLEGIYDAEEEVDVEPTQNPLKKYSSEYNIDALPSYKKKGKGNLICRLLRLLFRKKQKYRLHKIDPKDQEKIKQFIADVKDMNDSEETHHQRERQIEEDFKVMLENIFNNVANSPFSDLHSDSASVSSYSTHLEEEQMGLDLENTLPCSWFYIDAAQMEGDYLPKGGDGSDVDDLADADTSASSSANMDDDSDGEERATPVETGRSILDDVPIDDMLVKEGDLPTSERRKLKRGKRSINQTQGQTTSKEESHDEKNKGPGGKADNMGLVESLLPGNRDEGKKGQHDKTEAGHGGEDRTVLPLPPTSSTQPPSSDGSKPPPQRKFKSKFDIIHRFKNRGAVVDDNTGVSFDTRKYPSPASNGREKRSIHLEEHTEGKKDKPSEHIPNIFQQTNHSKESNKSSNQGDVVAPPPPLSPINYKKRKENEAIIKGGTKSSGHVKVDDSPGMIKDEKNKTSSGTKKETHVSDPNVQVKYDLLEEKHSSIEWITGNYDTVEEDEHADSAIYKYSASFAVIAIVLLGATFLYIRSEKKLTETFSVPFNDFATQKEEKKVECRDQHIELSPDETSWQ